MKELGTKRTHKIKFKTCYIFNWGGHNGKKNQLHESVNTLSPNYLIDKQATFYLKTKARYVKGRILGRNNLRIV